MQSANQHHYLQPGSSTNVDDSGTLSSSAVTSSSRSHDGRAIPILINKKRKIDRACDVCRRRKTKCDGPRMPENICTNCLQTHKSCTYVEASKPRGPPKAYVLGLEDRIEMLEALLKRLQPDSDFSEELGPPIPRGSWKTEDPSYNSDIYPASASLAASHLTAPPARFDASVQYQPYLRSNSSSPPVVRSALTFRSHFRPHRRPTRHDRRLDNESSSDYSSASSDTDELVDSDLHGRKKLTLLKKSIDENKLRFLGKSSAIKLITITRRFKEMHLLESAEGVGVSRKRMESSAPWVGDKQILGPVRRPQFWRTTAWEIVWEGVQGDITEIMRSALATFPPPDVVADLLHLYFLHVNTQFPLLHRPTFDRQWKAKLFERDIWFTAVCLSIFAVAGRWSQDPRILPAVALTETGDLDWTRVGWNYFDMVIDIHRARRSVIYPVSLFEAQTFTLMGMFLRGSSSYPAAWVFVSVGMRKVQDVGAHRKKVYSGKPTVDEELWKRVFWHLLAFDRIGGANLGRGFGVGEGDYDVDLPLEVDDEYWETEDPTLAFQQPFGVPSQICAFNLFIKLTDILAFSMQTVYAIDKNKIFSLFSSANWRDEAIVHLNLAMTEWVDSVPEHLRWSKKMDNAVFSNQATTLYTLYYFIQMAIYRPFIPSPPPISIATDHDAHDRITAESAFPFPAMEICTEAARACARIVEVQMERGLSNVPNLTHVAYHSAGMLLISLWDLKAQEAAQKATGFEDVKPPLAHQMQSLLADISVFIRALEWAEPRWEVVTPFLQKIRDSLPSFGGNVRAEFHHLRGSPEVAVSSPYPSYTPRASSSSSHRHNTSQWPGESHPWPLGQPIHHRPPSNPATASHRAPSPSPYEHESELHHFPQEGIRRPTSDERYRPPPFSLRPYSYGSSSSKHEAWVQPPSPQYARVRTLSASVLSLPHTVPERGGSTVRRTSFPNLAPRIDSRAVDAHDERCRREPVPDLSTSHDHTNMRHGNNVLEESVYLPSASRSRPITYCPPPPVYKRESVIHSWEEYQSHSATRPDGHAQHPTGMQSEHVYSQHPPYPGYSL